MELIECTDELELCPEPGYPIYIHVSNVFWDALSATLSEPSPLEDLFEDVEFFDDSHQAIDEILCKMYGCDISILDMYRDAYPPGHVPSHNYHDAIAQAKANTLAILKREVLCATVESILQKTAIYQEAPLATVEITNEAITPPSIGTIKANSNHVPPRFIKAAWVAPFRATGKYSKAETQALQQREMDDLIHLSKQGRSYSLHEKYVGLFLPSGQLDTKLARDFIEEIAWDLGEKAHILLKLTEFEQLQCRALASKKVNDKWRNSIKHAAKVEEKLNSQAEKDDAFRQYVGEFTKLAQAMYLCDGWDSKKLPMVLGWLTGKRPISRQAINAKIKRLTRRLA